MLLFVFVTFFVATTVSTSTLQVTEDLTFDSFLRHYRLKYSDNEKNARKNIFESELQRVLAHNRKGLSWKEKINRFSALTEVEKKQQFGYSKKTSTATAKQTMKHQHDLPEDFRMEAVESLPKSIDWRKKGIMTAVKDQGHCGSCWAFASTAVIESYVAKETGKLFDLSPEQIAMCAPNPDHCGGVGKCEGSTAELAFEYVSSSDGIYEEFQYPYVSYTGDDFECKTSTVAENTSPKGIIHGYAKLPSNNYTAVMNALAKVGPLAINVDASTWHAYSSGIYDGCDQDSPDVNHVVVLAGYGEDDDGKKYWLVRNSWSASWGEAGYIKLARKNDAETKCGMDVTPQDGVSCEAEKDQPQRVCGTCGVIYDSSFVLSAAALD